MTYFFFYYFTLLQSIFTYIIIQILFIIYTKHHMQHPRNKRVKLEIDQFQKDHSLKEIKLLHLHPQFHQATFAFTGPLDSPYEGYWFRIFVQWPENYPIKPLKAKLIDKIWNPYVDFTNNQICIDILKDQFTPGLTTIKILLSIISLLGESKISENHQGFANPKAAAQMMNNYPIFNKQARRKCQLYFYEKQEIYSDAQRGIPEEHIIKAEGKKLNKLVQYSYSLTKKINQNQKQKEILAKEALFKNLFGCYSSKKLYKVDIPQVYVIEQSEKTDNKEETYSFGDKDQLKCFMY